MRCSQKTLGVVPQSSVSILTSVCTHFPVTLVRGWPALYLFLFGRVGKRSQGLECVVPSFH